QAGLTLAECIRKLPAIHREIIDLVYYHRKSIEEIAGILDIPKNTVKTRMFHARRKLAELLAATEHGERARPLPGKAPGAPDARKAAKSAACAPAPVVTPSYA